MTRLNGSFVTASLSPPAFVKLRPLEDQRVGVRCLHGSHQFPPALTDENDRVRKHQIGVHLLVGRISDHQCQEKAPVVYAPRHVLPVLHVRPPPEGFAPCVIPEEPALLQNALTSLDNDYVRGGEPSLSLFTASRL